MTIISFIKTNVMKAICLSVAIIFFSLSAVAQNNPLDVTALPGLESNDVIMWNDLFKIQGLRFPKYNTIKLPLDNMPCFVPDVSSIALMPTLKTGLPCQFIPNPYFTYNTPVSTLISLPK